MFNLRYGSPPHATWVVNDEGDEVRRIVDADPGRDRRNYLGRGQYGYYAGVSPGGSRIVYSTCEYTYYDHDKVGVTYNRGYEIASVNVDGSGRQRLTDNVHFENYPVWSPDGNRIAFIAHNDVSRWADYFHYPDHYEPHNSEVFTRAADGTDERVVPKTKGVGLYPPVWSPDGQRLAFTAHEVSPPSTGRSEPQDRIIYTIRLDGSELSRIGEATTLPTWSPDGERVAFGLDDVIYTARYDGTDRREVLDDRRANRLSWSPDDFMPHDVSWSPDGTQLLLASNRGVHVVGPDGSGLRRLGPSVRTTNATWSPDGSMIAARREREVYAKGLAFVIFVMDRDGTDVRLLADGYVSSGSYDEEESRVRPIAVAPIDPATCSNGVAVPQPAANPGLVEDCEALIRSRYGLGPRLTTGWTTDTPISEWPGVAVGTDPPRVRGLDLRDKTPVNLTGLKVLISPELGNLTMLGWLTIDSNDLSGPIPPELGDLKRLRNLRLPHYRPSGCVPVGLPDIWVEASGLERCKP